MYMHMENQVSTLVIKRYKKRYNSYSSLHVYYGVRYTPSGNRFIKFALRHSKKCDGLSGPTEQT